jgi:methyl-accepting chemotaxis protein
MFQDVSIKHKLYGLNVFYLILLGIVVFFFFSYNGLIRNLSSTQEQTSALTTVTRNAAFAAKDYLAGRMSFSDLESAFQPLLTGNDQGKDANAVGIWNDLREIHALRQKNDGIEEEIGTLMALSIAQSNGFIEQMSKQLADPVARSEVSDIERLVIAGASVNTTSSYDLRLLFNRMKEDLNAKEEMLAFIDKLLSNVEADIKSLSGTAFEGMAREAKKANLAVKDLTLTFIDNIQKANALQDSVFRSLDQAMAGIEEEARTASTTFASKVKGYFQVIVAALCLTSILGISLSLVLAGLISRALARIIRNLSEASNQISSAAEQVSASGQSLAEGSSEQAASIEETSSSLEEISSMTRQNAENTRETNRVMSEEAGPNFQRIQERMGKMKASIEKTVANSDETAKIIKTIDEIAFQTNLLALNAAVEAARAGEAGAGFAVVADEVRNLAMRAAEAAKNTSDLIHASNSQINEAADLNAQVVAALDDNTTISGKVGKLISEVAAASEEQARGIDQISKAVAEMDKVTQQNAANAEESASASEELTAQSREMTFIVSDLLSLTGGRAVDQKSGKEPVGGGESADAGPQPSRAPVLAPGAHRTAPARSGKKTEIHPEQVIPLENDFQDF